MYVEFHARSAFSFLESTALPEALAEEAARLDQRAIALVDRDGVFGAPRLYRACTRLGLAALVGAEVTLDDGGQLPLLAEDREGYKNLCRLITRIKMRAPKGEGAATLGDLAEHAGGLVCLTGGEEGPVARRLASGDVDGARTLLDGLVGIYGRFNVYAELQRHLDRGEETRNDWLRTQAESHRLALLATNAPRLVRRQDRHLLDVLTCVRHHTTLDAAGRLLARNGERAMKSGRAMEKLFFDCPEAVANTAELSLRLAFTLKNLGYQFPEYPLPPGETPIGLLRTLSFRGARARYGRGSLADKARAQIERELALIERLDLAGYFLIVWDLVEYCRRERHPDAGARLRRQQRGLLRPRHHRGGPGEDGAPLRALPLRGARRVAGHRPRPAERRPPREGDPVRVRALRPARRGHDRQRDHLSRAERGPRGGKGPRLRRRPHRAAVPARQQLGVQGPGRQSARPSGRGRLRSRRSPRPALRPRSGRPSRTSRGISASTPAAWSSARAGSTRWCRSSPPPCPAARSSSGTRTIAPPSASSRWTCSASA